MSDNEDLMFGLKKLIHPVDKNKFVSEYKGKRALYIPGGDGRFEELFGWDDINHQLNFGRPNLEGIGLVFEKQSLPPAELARTSEWLIKGATLVLNSVDQIDPVVSHFADMLGRDMNRHVNINCYASCPAKQGFNIHYDRHDVFIVATEGKKAWKVFDPTYLSPLERQKFNKGDAPDADPYVDCTMEAGDVMYIPRGHWHYAIAETPSVHLTVGPHSGSAVDFLGWFADVLMRQEEFLRRDFPIVDLNLLGGEQREDDFEQHLTEFQEKMHEIFSDRESLREHIIQFSMTTMQARRNFNLPDMALLRDTITPQTRFRMASGQKFITRYDPDTKQAAITLKGHILELADVPVDLVESLLNTEGVITGEALIGPDESVKWESVRDFLVLLCERSVVSPAGTRDTGFESASN